jgi:hypothetical protein
VRRRLIRRIVGADEWTIPSFRHRHWWKTASKPFGSLGFHHADGAQAALLTARIPGDHSCCSGPDHAGAGSHVRRLPMGASHRASAEHPCRRSRVESSSAQGGIGLPSRTGSTVAERPAGFAWVAVHEGIISVGERQWMTGSARLLAAMMLVLAGWPAAGHDIYGSLRSNSGVPCCGGDEKTGDCEPVTYRLLPNGDALVRSKRYRAQVRVAKGRITWSAVPGSKNEAHWCGVPRAVYFGNGSRQAPLQYPPDDTDPLFVTICAFIDPGAS